ncbi:o-succinylbenzoate synthase [Sporolactobacillus inulinus]|uniref:o-succinylbenzoate synthase n=1 Tax=Sporolactobacillus inulinus CASD TaxID=1069536 RepID=A0A0U1QPF9_9BACL|nr:o-succinylbenzoate synthase [Sporolactobacillus inulinus]KLI02697.1 O-succinylbenzoate synthase [Sporolactobacillus inulinus CASD]GEB76048.1 o-succinylbenzoate synthase [Sporolactobacillus inulinus]
MKLRSVTMRLIASPLKMPFTTHLQQVSTREALILEVMDTDGRIGYGEADPFSSPWYSEETIQTCRYVLREFLIPILLHVPIKHPEELEQIWSGVRGNRMAKSGLGQAVWDLYAKQTNTYLGELFGGGKAEVDAGAVITAATPEQAVRQIEQLLKKGYKRYKIKISRKNDRPLLEGIRAAFPDLPIMADANSAYTIRDKDHLRELDRYRLMMIEQPLAYNDLSEHAVLQKKLATPICLDESISSYAAAASAVMLQSAKVVALKMGRVGGWAQAARIHKLCLQHSIPLWCGGMIEFGIAKAHNLALATLPGFTLPGDFYGSDHYWKCDLISPTITVDHGVISVPKDRPGIGFSIDRDALAHLSRDVQSFVNR